MWRTARRLHTALAGAVLTASDLRVPRLATVDLAGRGTLEVVPRGKHLLHRLEGGLTLHSHLRMDGSWRVHRGRGPREVLARHTVRAVLRTAEVTAVGDQLGMLDLVRTAEESSLVGHLGPDLLDPGFDRDRALSNVAADSRTIGEALLDQRNLAGIGTIFASEPLFLTGTHPWQPTAALGKERVAEVVDTARRMLVRSARLGRTATRGDQPEDTWVHARRGLPCRRCGELIRLAPIGQQPQQRVLSYCPRCQGGLAPTDDGAPQGRLGPRAG